MSKLLKVSLFLASALALSLLALTAHGVSPTRQELGGTGTSTVFSNGQLIYQGSGSYYGATLGTGLSLSGGVLTATGGSGATTTITAGPTINGPSFTYASGSPDTNWNILASGSTVTFDHPNNLLTTTTAASLYQIQGNYITGLTGDVTASGPGSVAATLATVNSNTGTWGNASTVPVITVNGKGLITGVSTTSVYSAFSASNPITFNSSTGAIGWTNSNNYITLGSLSGTAPITYNNGTGAIGVNTGDLTLNSSNLSFTSGDGKKILLGTSTTISLTANPTFTNLTYTNASGSSESLSGNLWVTATSTLATTTITKLTVGGNSISGTNSGDITLSGQNYLSLSGQALTANAVDLSGSNATGILAAGRFPALTGDVTTSAGALGTTLATVNTNVGSFGDGSHIPNFTVNGKGLITAAGSTAVTIPTVSGASPQVAYFTGSNTVNGSSAFLWDNTANSLLINTSTPAGASLYVVASTSAQTLPIFAVASTSGQAMFTVSPNNNIVFRNEALPTITGQKFFTVLGSQGGGVMRVARDIGVAPVAGTYGTQDITAYTSTSTEDFPNLTGPTQSFSIASGTMQNIIGAIGAQRDGNDTTGDFLLESTNNSSLYINAQLNGNTANPSVVLTGVPGASTVLTVASSSAATLLFVQGNGLVGIDTTTPTAMLSVAGTSTLPTQALLTVASSSGATYLKLFADGGLAFASSTPDATTTAAYAGQYYSAEFENGTITAATTIDWGKANMQHLVASSTSAITLTFANTHPGGRYLLEVQQGYLGSDTITWPGTLHWSGGTAPTLTTSAGQVDVITFECGFTTCKGAASLNYSP